MVVIRIWPHEFIIFFIKLTTVVVLYVHSSVGLMWSGLDKQKIQKAVF